MKNKKLVLVFLTVILAGIFMLAKAGVSSSLLNAMIMVESSGNDLAIGDKHLRYKAYGCLQVRQVVCDDVNEKLGTGYQAIQCLGDRRLSKEICRKYLAIYATEKRLGHTPTNEDYARIWNGGPDGVKKSETEVYWQKVQKQMKGGERVKVSMSRR